MSSRWVWITSFLLLASAAERAETAEISAQGDKRPLLRLEAAGPTAYVTGLTFSPDGETLYAAGWDKVVRLWTRAANSSQFRLDARTFRVPIGPGMEGGTINALALSADGTWLAAAGKMLFREGAGFFKPGLVMSALGGMTKEMEEDQGTIYVFNTKDRTAPVRTLRRHRGPVVSLAFGPSRSSTGPPVLVSAAEEKGENFSKPRLTVLVWDVAKGRAVAGPVIPRPKLRPGLAVWRDDSRPEQVHVAVAAGDGRLHVWKVSSGPPEATGDGVLNNNITAAYVPGLDRLLTGSFRAGKTHLQTWQVLARGQPQADVLKESFPPQDGIFYSPRALVLVSARADGKLDHAALVLQPSRADQKYRLCIISLDPAGFGTIVNQVSLWEVGTDPDQPALAAAPHGRYLAVAGNKEHAIHVYAVSDLLHKRGLPPQVLRSPGTIIGRLQFVNKGKDTGLLLSSKAGKDSSAPRPGANDLVFNFTKGELAADPRDWNQAAPGLRGWTVISSKFGEIQGSENSILSRSFRLVVSHEDRQVGRVELRGIWQVTACALLPPEQRLQTPLLAIAYLDLTFQPWLGLYDATTGKQVRQLTGHQDQIHDLAFSADGRLLASAAEDQTVCVWSLTDLGRVLRQQGAIHGVEVGLREGDVRVERLDPASMAPANRQNLRQGDVVDEVVEGTKRRRLSSPFEFYQAAAGVAPGQRLIVHIRDRGDVALIAGQGTDESKPLLTLFVARGGKPDQWTWVGWNPTGYYDARDDDAERFLGWHFNTGKPDQPADFALIDQYRKDYYQRGILGRLIEEGQLPRPEEREEEPPTLTIWIDDDTGQDLAKLDGQVLLREPPHPTPSPRGGEGRVRGASLKLAVDKLPRAQGASVKWQIDGDKVPRAFTAVSEGVWSADLVQVPWKRGVNTIRAWLHLEKPEPRDYQEELRLLYLPPAPRVKSDQLGQHLRTDRADFTFQAAVDPGLPDQDLVVRLVHKHNGQSRETEISKPWKIKQNFALLPGDNIIEVVAVSKEALSPYVNYETTRQSLLVTFEKKEPPRISLDTVVTVPGGSEPGRTRKLEPGKPIIVDVPMVQIVGVIDASDDLAEAQGTQDRAVPRTLAGFERNKYRKFAVREPLNLSPGRQEFRISAKTKAGAAQDSALTIDYFPRLPALTLTSPPSGLTLYEGQDPLFVPLEGVLSPALEPQDYKARVWVNGRAAGEPSPVRGEARKLSLKVPLQPGNNSVQVKLYHAWNQVSMPAEPILVRYQRPPHHIHFLSWQAGVRPMTDLVLWPRWAAPSGTPQLSEKPLTDLAAALRSSLPVALVEAEIVGNNGRKRITGRAIQQGPTHLGNWSVQLKDVPLDRGLNLVRVWASNQEGRCRQAGTLLIVYQPRRPSPPRALVELRAPARDDTVELARYQVELRVRSESRLKRVELRRGKEVLFAVPVTDLKQNSDGVFDLTETPMVTLERGPNRLELLAVNEGGEQSAAPITLSYVPRPVRVLVDKLEFLGSPGGAAPARYTERNALTFAEVPTGRVRLHGRVAWGDEKDDRLHRGGVRVLVWVNSVKHVSKLKDADGDKLERAFAVDIELTQSTQNRVKIEVPDLQLPPDSLPEFSVNCLRPEQVSRRLHVLIVAPGVQEESKLKKTVLGALGARADDPHGNQFRTPVFEGYLAPILTGSQASQMYVQGALARLGARLKLRPIGDRSIDVVIVYYQGEESAWMKISRDSLGYIFADVPGAQLLLVDVMRPALQGAPSDQQAPDRMAQWAHDSRVGVFCYVWVNRGQPPKEDARLTADLAEGMSQARKLRDLVSHLKTKFEENPSKPIWVSRVYGDSLFFAPYLPDMMMDLLIAARP